MEKIFIASCKSYHGPLEVTYRSIKRLIPTSLVTIVSDAPFPIQSGDRLITKTDEGWNLNILSALSDLDDSECVIITMDDLELRAFDALGFQCVMKIMYERRLDALSLYSTPISEIAMLSEPRIGLIRPASGTYMLSTMFSAFRVGFLRGALTATSNPWEFERRSREVCLEGGAYFCNFNVVDIANLVNKGRWVSWRSETFAQKGLKPATKVSDSLYILRMAASIFRNTSIPDLIKFIVR